MKGDATVHPDLLCDSCRTAVEVKSAEFILVNDGSMQDVSLALNTGRQLQHLFGADFKYLHNKKARGYGLANNLGVTAASAKYVILVNNDAHVVTGWLKPLVATIKSSSRVGMVRHIAELYVFKL